jgi:hypothetical protein
MTTSVGIFQRVALQQYGRQVIHSRRFPALYPRIGIDARGLADADIIIQRSAGKVIKYRRKERGLPITPPLRQMAARPAELPAMPALLNHEMCIVSL